MPNSLRVTFSLTEEIRQRVLKLAMKEHKTMSQIVKDAVAEYEVNHPETK